MPAIKFSSACLLVKDFMEVTDNLIRDAYGDPYCSCARAPGISPKEYAFLADVWVPLQVTEKIKHFKKEYVGELVEPADIYYRMYCENELREEQISLDPRDWGDPYPPKQEEL